MIKNLIKNLNDRGIPLPMVRDPKTGKGSVTVTLVVVSSGACFIIVLLMIANFIAKWSDLFIFNEDTLTSLKEAFNSSFNVLVASLAAYLGRKWQSDKNQITLSENVKKDNS